MTDSVNIRKVRDRFHEHRSRFRLRRIVLGLKSGLISTVVMTVFRMPIARSPPPTANFWSRYIGGGEPEDHTLIGLVLHLAYGAAAGVIFAMTSSDRPTHSPFEAEVRGSLRGIGFGLLLSIFGERVILTTLLAMDLKPDERYVFHLSHIIYGLTLGVWTGARTN